MAKRYPSPTPSDQIEALTLQQIHQAHGSTGNVGMGTNPGVAKMSDKDISDVTGRAGLTKDQLKTLFFELGLEESEIVNAEDSAGARDYKLEAAAVLRHWRQTKGIAATRNEIIESLNKCGLNDAKEVLQKKWGIDIPQPKATTNFNLTECQEELRDFYQDEMSKVQLLPWMPDDTADMESIFVDLELIKKERARPSAGTTKLESIEDLVTLKTSQGQRVNRVLIQGEAGIGKSTLTANIAYRWALQDPKSPLSQFQLVFVISMHEIQDRNTSLVDLIFQQILPEDSKVSKEGLESYITDHANDVLLLIDGLDEDSSGMLKNRSSGITTILHNRKLRKCCVILTTRPHKVDDLGEHQKHYTQIKLTGFSMENIEFYIQKFFQDEAKSVHLLTKLKQEFHIIAMAAVPVLLLMICLLWQDQCSLPNTKTQLYKQTIKYLWKRYQGKEGQEVLPTDGESEDDFEGTLEDLLNRLGKTVFDNISKEEEKVVFSERDFGSDTFNLGCRVGLISRERLRSKLSSKISVTFLHKSFQDFCAGLYLANLLDTDRSKFVENLGKTYWFAEAGLVCRAHTLDFCCGLKPQITSVFFQHFVITTANEAPLAGNFVSDLSVHLSHIFESQLSYEECSKLAQSVTNNFNLQISHILIPYVRYLFNLLESSASQDGLFFSKLIHLVIFGCTNWLQSLLKYTTNLTYFHMVFNNTLRINTSELNMLFKTLSALPKLNNLILMRDIVMFHHEIDITYFLQILSQSPNQFVSLTFIGLKFDSTAMVKCLLRSKQSLCYLFLCGTHNVNGQLTALGDIFTILPDLRKLTELLVSNYQISSAIKYLRPIVSQLHILKLVGTGLRERHMKELFSFLHKGQNLKSFSPSGNVLSSSSVESLIKCLKGIPNLEELDLEQTCLNDESACILATGLKEMTTIKTLALGMNPLIGEKGKDALKDLPMRLSFEESTEQTASEYVEIMTGYLLDPNILPQYAC